MTVPGAPPCDEETGTEETTGQGAGHSRNRPSGKRLAQVVVLGVLVAAVVVLYERLADYPWHRMTDDLAALGPGPVIAAVLATALSYGIMIAYDALALSYVEHAMPARRYAAASFVATAFGNTLGASALVGAALRARVYSAWGLPAFAITRVAGFNLVTLTLGSSVLIAVGLAWAPSSVLSWLPVNRIVGALLAAALVGLVAVYMLWCGRGKPPVTVRGWRIDRPSRLMAVTQLVVSVVEWMTMAAVLFALLPEGHGLDFLPFAVLFVLATTLGLLSNVPGGLGVVEAVLVVALGGSVPSTALVTALIAYRMIYYLAPLALAAVVLAVLEARRHPGRATGLVRSAGVLTPSLLALLTGVLGGFLVVTGELPGGPSPTLSTFGTSVAGVALLILARGLHRRLHGAWAVALVVLGLFAGTHQNLVSAAAALGIAVLLVLARRIFTRTTSWRAVSRRWVWPGAVAAVGLLLAWYETWVTEAYGDRTWMETLTGNGSWPSRLGLAVAVVVLVVAGSRLQVPDAGPEVACADDYERAVPVMAQAGQGNASLLWTGDKRVLFSAGGNALLMYRVEGRSWVVMGDPVGDDAEFDELIWRFLDLCDSRCGRPVFYCVRDDIAELYREHGLALVKLGEEAMIPLPDFTMSGSRRSKLRSEVRASERAGVEIEVVDGDRLRAVLPQLREVSDLWLDERHTREKSFSLGFFDEEYVVRFPVAVARIDDRVVAFATLWASGARHEVKVDLMRRRPEAPRTVMTHLFVASMTWAHDQGYDTFNIGMAPLAGMRTDGTGSSWERIGHLLWTHGEHFYNDTVSVTPGVDLATMVEIFRQSGYLAMHEHLGVPLENTFLLRDVSASLAPGADRLRVDGPARLVMDLHLAEPFHRRGELSGYRCGGPVTTIGGDPVGEVQASFSWLSRSTFATLRAVTRQRLGLPATPPSPAWSGSVPPTEAYGRRSPRNAVVAEPVHDGDVTTAWLRPDLAYVSLFDHAYDHVPGVVQVEGAKQLAVLAAAHRVGVDPDEVVARHLSAAFASINELDFETRCTATVTRDLDAGGFRVTVRMTQEERDLGDVTVLVVPRGQYTV